MKTLRSGLIILVVIAFLAGAYFITNSGKRSFSSAENSPNIKLSSLNQALDNRYNFDENNNLTKSLGQNLFKEIQNNNLVNQEKKTLSSDVSAASENLATKVINDSLSDFKLVSTIYDSDIKISADISKEAKSQYLKTIGEINQKNFGNFNKNYIEVIVDTYQKIDSSSAKRLADIFKNIAADFSKVSVPADWVDVHKTLIIYAKNAEIIYRAMANYPVDPIKGYLALETVDSLVSGAEGIRNMLIEKLKEIGS